ncbi:MAG TPA: HIT family protein [Cytophagales bacterium]|nr:HIT family protein [Cytophagales bacterium]
MASIFSKIIKGEIPSYKIAEDENFFAFLDVMPVAKGHVLVVTKKEVDYIFDLEDDLLNSILAFSKPIAKAIEKAIPCKRIGVSVIGLEVPHVHVHLVPLNTMNDINFTKPKLKFSEKEMEDIRDSIKKFL